MPWVRIAVGCHPHNAASYTDDVESRLRELVRDRRVCAIGEIGLDYYYDLSPRDVQIDVFRRQLRLAHELDLPVVLHIRDAHDDALRVLEEEGFPQAGTLLHCCGLDPEELAPWIEHDCYVAFGGLLTFKRSDAVRAAALTVPKDRLVVETDAPYMTPEPMRGMPCEPAHVVFTAQRLCEIADADTLVGHAEMSIKLMGNARRLLDQPPRPWQDKG